MTATVPRDVVYALVDAWRRRVEASHTFMWMYPSSPHDVKPSCGRWGLLVSSDRQRTATVAQRLGELLRLLPIAARVGADVLQYVRGFSPFCPHYLQCDWCDGVDDRGSLTVRFAAFRDGDTPALLTDALRRWDDASASAEFHALRDALQALAARRPELGARQIDLCVSLEPCGLTAARVPEFTKHVDQLLSALATADHAIAGLVGRHVVFNDQFLRLAAKDFATLLATLLRHAIPTSLLLTGNVMQRNVDTLLTVCEAGASLAHVTTMTLRLPPPNAEHPSTLPKLLTVLSTQCPRLRDLSIEGMAFPTQRDADLVMELLATALWRGPRQLTSLSMHPLHLRPSQLERLVYEVSSIVAPDQRTPLTALSLDRRNLSFHQLSTLFPSVVERVELHEAVTATVLMPWLLSRPSIRDLSLWKIVSDRNTDTNDKDNDQESFGDAVVPSWPPIESLTCSQSSPELLSLLKRLGSSLKHLSITSSLNERDVDVVTTLLSHCTKLESLSVCGIRCESVEVLASGYRGGDDDDDDDGCGLRGLKELTICPDHSRSMASACVRLLQLLSDPSHFLSQSLRSLKLIVLPEDYAVVCKAMHLMLRCNNRIVSVELERISSDVDDDEEQQQQQTNWSDSEDDFELLEEGVDPVSSAIVNEMIVAARDKTAIPLDGVVRGVVTLPTIRSRAAFLSVLAAHGLDGLAPGLVMTVLTMAGRPAFRSFMYN